MSALGVLLVVLAVLVANVPAVRQEWRRDRAGSIKALELLVAYFVYCALGVVLLVLTLPPRGTGEGHEDKAFELTGLVVNWFMYGGLTLMRVVPRNSDPPGWLMHFGIADVLVLGLMFACLGLYLWI